MKARLSERNPVTLLIIANTILGVVVVAIVLMYLARITEDAEVVHSESQETADLARIREQLGHVRVFTATETLRAITGGRPIPREALDAATLAMLTISNTQVRVDFARLEGGPATVTSLADLSAAYLTYLNEQTPEARSALATVADDAQTRLHALDPLAVEENETRLDNLVTALRRMQWMTLALGALAITAAELATWIVGNRVLRTVASLHSREQELLEANRGAERRNEQFRSLYFIVSEVMETLSIKYVVNTTVREARKLVEAEVVILRILEDGRLRTRGIETAAGITIVDVEDDLGLGEGLAGRAAKRGRTVQLELPTTECEYTDGRADGVRSGVIVPLIVGARVVGAISCWSPASGEFSTDDVQVLEMMASQVASAIAAAELHETSEHEAHHDPLTTLPNRRQLSLDIRYELDTAVRRGREMAIAMFDIDHFKQFNDEFGHQAGDAALQHVAEILKRQLRRQDQVYRYGGEEFAVVFDSLSLSDAREACERLRVAVELAAMPSIPGAHLTISGGLVALPGPWHDFDSALSAADEALYNAKETGRNRIAIVASETTDEAEARAA